MLDLVKDALDILRSQYPSTPVPESSPQPVFKDLFLPSSERPVQTNDLLFEFKGPDSPAMILHSSGSHSSMDHFKHNLTGT